MGFDVLFEEDLRDGRVVGVSLPPFQDGVDPLGGVDLPGAEVSHCQGLGPRRQISFIGGRLALRKALASLGAPTGAVLADDRGAPILPAGFRGSISHKDSVAVALATPDEGWSVGIDVEIFEPERLSIARKVLRDDELGALEALPEGHRWRDVLLRFSAKEAIYKAIDPTLRRYVTFKEVAVWPSGDGSMAVELFLSTPEALEISCRWTMMGDTLVTLARARPATLAA